MAFRNSLVELAIVVGLFLLGLTLRFTVVSHCSVEHFDEGIYAATLWYDAQFGESYPASDFYAPPLLSSSMALCDLIPGMQSVSPFLPSILAGAATVLALWALARAWFGQSAGIMAAAIVSLSDFHMMYSRMALTDVMALLWMVMSVDRAVRAIERRSMLTMLAAGAMCGLAWWSKYTGWLPLAIVISGSWLWWLWRGRKEVSAMRLLMLQGVFAGSAVLVFSPWWWHLQAVGGYSAVAANHAGYFRGLESWKENLSTQLASQFWLDGLPGNLSVGLGMLMAGCLRWTGSCRFTWNSSNIADGFTSGQVASPPTSAVPAPQDTKAERLAASAVAFPPFALLIRFVTAGIALTAIAISIWTPLLLTCLAMGGMAGVFLWPVLSRLYQRARQQDFSPASPGGIAFSAGDFQGAPTVNPQLGACVVLTWLTGLLIATPMYHPYPRLFLPLLAAIWIGAAAGVGWWIESNLSVARRPTSGLVRTRDVHVVISHMVTIMLMFAVGLSLMTSNSILSSLTWQNRTSLAKAAGRIANQCFRDATDQLPRTTPLLPSGSIIRPVTAEPVAEIDEMIGTASELQAQKMVIYAFGEPALLYHLNDLGILAAPISHLNVSQGPSLHQDLPQYLVIGPYAKRTPGFWDELMAHQQNFQLIGEFQFLPGEIVLLNLFDAGWLRDHPESRLQTLEVYRIRPTDTETAGN